MFTSNKAHWNKHLSDAYNHWATNLHRGTGLIKTLELTLISLIVIMILFTYTEKDSVNTDSVSITSKVKKKTFSILLDMQTLDRSRLKQTVIRAGFNNQVFWGKKRVQFQHRSALSSLDFDQSSQPLSLNIIY